MSEKMKVLYPLSAILAALMLVQSLLGLLFQEQYRDVAWIKAAWFGNDWVTLIIAVPLLIVGIIFATRGSIRGLLLWLGMLGYAVYNYAYYLFGVALNTFFLFYVAALVLAVVTLILSLSRIDSAGIRASFETHAPVRLVGGYFVFVGIGLAAVWLMMWAAYAFTGQPTPIEPEAFKVVAAIDISIIVPTLVFGGLLLWRRHTWGYILAAMAGILGSVYLIVLLVNSFVQIRLGFAESPGELPIWGTLAAFTIAATLLLLTHVRNAEL